MALDLKEVFQNLRETGVDVAQIDDKYKVSQSDDVCAFILLDKLAPSGDDIVSCAEHDIIFLSTDVKALAEKATEADVAALAAFGVLYSEEYDCLMMFR